MRVRPGPGSRPRPPPCRIRGRCSVRSTARVSARTASVMDGRSGFAIRTATSIVEARLAKPGGCGAPGGDPHRRAHRVGQVGAGEPAGAAPWRRGDQHRFHAGLRGSAPPHRPARPGRGRPGAPPPLRPCRRRGEFPPSGISRGTWRRCSRPSTGGYRSSSAARACISAPWSRGFPNCRPSPMRCARKCGTRPRGDRPRRCTPTSPGTIPRGRPACARATGCG